MEAMPTTITLNVSIAANPIGLFINLVVMYSYVAEEGRLHDNIASPARESGWRGFRIFHAVMFVAAVALLAIAALVLVVIPKCRSNCSPIGGAPSLPTNGDIK